MLDSSPVPFGHVLPTASLDPHGLPDQFRTKARCPSSFMLRWRLALKDCRNDRACIIWRCAEHDLEALERGEPIDYPEPPSGADSNGSASDYLTALGPLT